MHQRADKGFRADRHAESTCWTGIIWINKIVYLTVRVKCICTCDACWAIALIDNVDGPRENRSVADATVHSDDELQFRSKTRFARLFQLLSDIE